MIQGRFSKRIEQLRDEAAKVSPVEPNLARSESAS